MREIDMAAHGVAVAALYRRNVLSQALKDALAGKEVPDDQIRDARKALDIALDGYEKLLDAEEEE
jgi:hypothetical protein